ncbi:MAG: AzlD domain-containing protein [Chloroflexi bacterium]|nr:AzlD domain-containing protein [Chloroflexota bacterium]
MIGEGALWLVLGMAVITYASRAALLLAAPGELPQRLGRWLAFVPVGLFAALIAAMVSGPGAPPLDLGRTLALGAGALVAVLTHRVSATIIAGLAVWWVVRLLSGGS